MVKFEAVTKGNNMRFGLNKGVERVALKAVKPAPRSSKRAAFRRKLIGETVGYQPYEIRVMDMNEISEKKALRFAKKRLGDIRRAKKKVRQMVEVKRTLIKRA